MQDLVAVVGSSSDIDFMNILVFLEKLSRHKQLAWGGSNSLRQLSKTQGFSLLMVESHRLEWKPVLNVQIDASPTEKIQYGLVLQIGGLISQNYPSVPTPTRYFDKEVSYGFGKHPTKYSLSIHHMLESWMVQGMKPTLTYTLVAKWIPYGRSSISGKTTWPFI